MEIKEALDKINAHKDLLGKKMNGASIDELIIVPTNNLLAELI